MAGDIEIGCGLRIGIETRTEADCPAKIAAVASGEDDGSAEEAEVDGVAIGGTEVDVGSTVTLRSSLAVAVNIHNAGTVGQAKSSKISLN